MKHTILVVEDEQAIRDMMVLMLEQHDYQVKQADSYQQALAQLTEPYPELILLDWMLPGGSGVQLAKAIKKQTHTKDIPIIMLTARAEEHDKLQGFEVGVDDYVTKPFSPVELIARIKAVLRRALPTSDQQSISYHGLTLDPSSHQVSIDQQAVDIGPTEFKLLHFFMTHTERVYSREQLLDNVWGTNVFIDDRTVDVHIRRLRKAISGQGHDSYIQTVRGAGYRFSVK